MHYSLTFPIVDLRPILPDANKLDKPSWPLPIPETSFIRNFGCIRTRQNGGSEFWGSEDKFCDAKGVIRFNNLSKTVKPIYRRFYSDGFFMNKLEVGLECMNDLPIFLFRQQEFDLEPLLKTLSLLDVTIKNRSVIKSVPLLDAGKDLAICYADSSTIAKRRDEYIYGNLIPCSPLLILVYQQSNIIKLPKDSNRILENIDFTAHMGQVTLDSLNLKVKNKTLKTWIIGIPRVPILRSLTDQKTWQKAIRDLRINLSRIHIEKETAATILSLLNTKSIRLKKGSDEAKLTSTYLTKVSNKILKPIRYNIEQKNLLDFALQSDIDIYAGQNQTISELLDFVESKYLESDLQKIFPQDR